jgi:N-methylhydantoinase A
MASAIFKEVAVKGYNPKHFVILSYGGGGPIHACGYASAIGISRILIPPFSSVFSALGAGNMDQLHIHEKSLYLMLYDATKRHVLDDYTVINETIEELEQRGKEDLMRQGVDLSVVKTRVELDMRYGNQLAQIGIVSPINRVTSANDIITLLDRFSENYAQRFGEGSQAPEAGVRINVIRVVAYVEHERLELVRSTKEIDAKPTPRTERECSFPDLDAPLMTPVFDHHAVEEGMSVTGPALIETPRTTYLVEPGWTLTMGSMDSAMMVKDDN